jgi:hypothetical protein
MARLVAEPKLGFQWLASCTVSGRGGLKIVAMNDGVKNSPNQKFIGVPMAI